MPLTMRALGWILAAAALSGCGYTVGDSCTTSKDCGGKLCIVRSELPGGYCSTTCDEDSDCPHGSVCISGVLQGQSDTRACLRSCTRDSDCRSGYRCAAGHQSPNLVCVGTAF